MTRKRQICISLDDGLYEELLALSGETGLPLSRVCELRLRGYDVVKSGGK